MKDLQERFEQVCRDFGIVGGSATLFKNNSTINLTYGYRERGAKVTENTIYRIASISKVIVALAAMKLVEEKKLDLDQDISDYLGYKVRNIYFPEDIITTRMLMTQTSSITDGFDDEDLTNETRRDGYNGVNGTSLDVPLRTLLVPNDSPYYTDLTFDHHQPGTNFIYSNFGCGILACIIEKISGKLFTEYVKEVLLNPLGLDASFRADEIKKFDCISSTYVPDNGEMVLRRTKESFKDSVYPFFPLGENYRGPAGGLFISMPDLAKIMIMLINRGTYEGLKLFERETIEQMFEKNWTGIYEEYRAKGLQMIIFDDLFGHKFYGHFGSAYGVGSFMLFDKDQKMGMCFINNGRKDFSSTDFTPNVHLKMLELLVK